MRVHIHILAYCTGQFKTTFVRGEREEEGEGMGVLDRILYVALKLLTSVSKCFFKQLTSFVQPIVIWLLALRLFFEVFKIFNDF